MSFVHKIFSKVPILFLAILAGIGFSLAWNKASVEGTAKNLDQKKLAVNNSHIATLDNKSCDLAEESYEALLHEQENGGSPSMYVGCGGFF